jgi:peptidoglycan/LPS O-acetylase OafA/YrhL
VPLALNQGERMWFSLLLFSIMFTGTVMYRVTTGEVSGRVGWSVVAFAVAVSVLVHFIHVESRIEPLAGARVSWQTESLTFVLALGAFVIAMALRQRAFPRVLSFFGRISYSLYLVHTLVLYAVPWWSESAAASLGTSNKILTYATWVGLTVAISWLTFRIIEKPFQDLGHRLTKRRVAPVPATT